jgi:hypothetical protein
VKISAIHFLLRRATKTKCKYAFRYPKKRRKRAA